MMYSCHARARTHTHTDTHQARAKARLQVPIGGGGGGGGEGKKHGTEAGSHREDEDCGGIMGKGKGWRGGGDKAVKCPNR